MHDRGICEACITTSVSTEELNADYTTGWLDRLLLFKRNAKELGSYSETCIDCV